jgi:hypothetical protein
MVRRMEKSLIVRNSENDSENSGNDVMASQPQTVTRLLAYFATAWILAASSGAAWLAIGTVRDISSNKSTIIAVDHHAAYNSDRINALSSKIDNLSDRLTDQISQVKISSGRCDDLSLRIDHLEQRCDSMYQSRRK